MIGTLLAGLSGFGGMVWKNDLLRNGCGVIVGSVLGWLLVPLLWHNVVAEPYREQGRVQVRAQYQAAQHNAELEAIVTDHAVKAEVARIETRIIYRDRIIATELANLDDALEVAQNETDADRLWFAAVMRLRGLSETGAELHSSAAPDRYPASARPSLPAT